MQSMERTASQVAPPSPLAWRGEGGRDQVVVLRNITWQQYEQIDRAKGDDAQPLIAYLDGELELVTTSNDHERIKKMLGRLIEIYAVERGLRLDGFGHATLRKKVKRAGAEPDEWYKTRKGSKMPDLAIEVVFTSGGVDKLEIYRRFGIPEMWFWVNGKIWVYHLIDRAYEERSHSLALPDIDLGELERIVAASDEDTDQSKVMRAYRDSLQRHSARRPR